MKLDKYITDRARHFELIYRDIETEILIEIAKMINDNGITASGQYKLERLNELIGLDRNVIETLSQITGKPMQEIISTMNTIGFGSIDFTMYRKAYEVGAITKSIDHIILQPYIDRTTETTYKLIKSVETKAKEQSFKQFRAVIDKATIEVNNGIKTPAQAMIDSVKQLNKQGIRSATYMSKDKEIHHQLESVMLRTIRTEFIKVSNDTSHNVGIDLGVEHWYITQHLGARDKGTGYENHALWQGTVVTTEELETVAGYGEITGLGGINCRHRHYAHIPGVSVEPPPRIDLEENSRVYALTQKQRRLERDVRSAKREVLMLQQFEQSIDDVAQAVKESKQEVRRRQAILKKFVDSNSELRRNYTNEKVIGY